MTDPTPDEAASSLQAVLDVLDAGGRHCGCDPDLYEARSDYIGSVSDSQGRNHHEVRAGSIRALLAERDLLRAHVDILVQHLGGCAKQTDSAFWQDLAQELRRPEFRTEYFSRAAQVRALGSEEERP